MRALPWIVAATLSAVFAAPPALAAEAGAADPGPRVSAPESLPVVRTEAWHVAAPARDGASATLVGGPGEEGPPPCGPCRVGFDDCGRPRWGGNLWLGGWLWGQTGTVGADGREGDIDTTPADAFDLFKDYGESALTGGGRLSYGRWFAQAWVSIIHLGGEKDVLATGEPIDVEVEGATAEFVVGYRAGEIALGCSPCSPCLAFEPYVGVRYNSIDISVDGPTTSVGEDQAWWDPVVGCTFQFDFRNKWYASVAASIGGFGVGSDFTWSARADVGYMFTRHFGVFTGICAIDWDYEDGGFKYDLTQWGPYVGFIFQF